jgi:hypothetical protein
MPFLQFRALLSILEVDVLPEPRIPQKRKAFGTLSIFIEFVIASTMVELPIKPEKFFGLYFKARGKFVFFSIITIGAERPEICS